MPAATPGPKLRLLLATLACLFVLQSPPLGAVDAGQPAPDLSIKSADGKPLALADLRGKTVYLDFWASWCGPCRQSFPWMNAMHDKYAASGLAIVAVNVDQKRADADRFLTQFPARFTVVYDAPGITPKSYGIKAMPTSVLIDRDGRVTHVHNGFRNEERDALEEKIRAIVARK
jgi:thiol-disulfide isomerase/thioredoxin